MSSHKPLQFAVRKSSPMGAIVIATCIAVCGGFLASLAVQQDPVERLYQMDAERDRLARSLERSRTTPEQVAPKPPPSAGHEAPVIPGM